MGQVELPFNSTFDFKYVVDGVWLVAEEEGKSWDAAGNVNNVYITGSPRTPPPAAKEGAVQLYPASSSNLFEPPSC